MRHPVITAGVALLAASSAGDSGVRADQRRRGAQPHAGRHQEQPRRASRLSRELAAVLVPRPVQPADRLQPRTVRGRGRGDRRRGRRSQSEDRIRQGHLRRPHSRGGAEQDRSGMRIDHGQCRARQTGGVLAADVRRRHQADGAEGLRRLGGDRPEGQDRGGDQGHHQRAGDAQCRQEVLARPEHRDRRRITSSPTRCWWTARRTRSRPTTSCSTA